MGGFATGYCMLVCRSGPVPDPMRPQGHTKTYDPGACKEKPSRGETDHWIECGSGQNSESKQKPGATAAMHSKAEVRQDMHKLEATVERGQSANVGITSGLWDLKATHMTEATATCDAWLQTQIYHQALESALCID